MYFKCYLSWQRRKSLKARNKKIQRWDLVFELECAMGASAYPSHQFFFFYKRPDHKYFRLLGHTDSCICHRGMKAFIDNI